MTPLEQQSHYRSQNREARARSEQLERHDKVSTRRMVNNDSNDSVPMHPPTSERLLMAEACEVPTPQLRVGWPRLQSVFAGLPKNMSKSCKGLGGHGQRLLGALAL